MNKYTILFSTIFILLFSACSSKEVYVPQQLSSEWTKYEENKQVIIDTSSNVALLENKKVLTKTDVINLDVNDSFRVVSQSDEWIITASIDGHLILNKAKDIKIVKVFELKKTIASASVDKDTLAVLFADNEIALYDLKTKNILFKEQGGKSITSDSRIVNPYFMKGLVLFASLDGKVIIVNRSLKKRLRTVIISSQNHFNNVISLGVVENKIIAATGYSLLSLSREEKRVDYEIRNVAYDETTIYVATKQGEILFFTSDLELKHKVRFPFAHFYGIINLKDKLYILEKEGYLIVMDKNSFEYSVHEIDLDKGFVFTGNKEFYVHDKKIIIE